MKRSFASVLTRSLFTLLCLPFLFSSQANATEGVNVQTFNPSTSDHFVLLEDALMSQWPKQPKLLFGVNYNYVDTPLVALDSGQTTKQFNYIDSIQTLDLFFGFHATSKFALYFAAPVHFISFPSAAPAPGLSAGSATSLGDLKIMGKLRITDDTNPFGVAIIPEIHLPTGNTADFVSDGSTYLGVRLAFERKFDTFTFNGNIGYANASSAIYEDASLASGIDYRQRLFFGLGGYANLSDRWGMSIEYSSIHLVPFDKNLNPNELYGGLRYLFNESMIGTLGASLGKIGGPSGQNYRIIAGLRFTLYDEDAKAMAPVAPYVAPTPAPTPYAAEPAPVSRPNPAVRPNVVFQAKRIEIMTPIEFSNNSDRLTADSKVTLDEVAVVLIKNQKSYKKILIDGHTNNIGNDKFNLRLSLARAKAVKKYLLTRKVPAARLEARGFGKRRPKISYSEPNAIEINRRVEFVVVK